jgi:DNA-binding response OmpR family regulator
MEAGVGELRVLIVDDSPTIVAQLDRVLSEVVPDAEVYAAPDVASARELFLAHKPNVVFLDVMLGNGHNGVQLLPALAKADWETHAVVTSALPRDHPDVIAMFSHGALCYMQKPVRRASVMAVLHELESET